MSRLTLSVTNFLLKFVISMLVLWVASRVAPGQLISNWVVFITAIIIAIVGVVTDETLLPRMGNTPALACDFVINAAIIWLLPNIWHANPVTLLTGLVCSLVITAIEYTVHVFVLRTDRLLERQ